MSVPQPTSRDTGACRSCGARVWWVMLTTGKRNPLDPEPNAERGNVLVERVNESVRGRVIGGQAVIDARHDGLPLYLSHFATCPNADRHRTHRRERPASAPETASPAPGSPSPAPEGPSSLFDVKPEPGAGNTISPWEV